MMCTYVSGYFHEVLPGYFDTNYTIPVKATNWCSTCVNVKMTVIYTAIEIIVCKLNFIYIYIYTFYENILLLYY